LPWVLGFCAVFLLAAFIVALSSIDVAPRKLAAYLSYRAEGHSAFFTAPADALASLLTRLDRGAQTPAVAYPAWAGAMAKPASASAAREMQLVDSPESLREAIAKARPGERIEILPGTYHVSGNAIGVDRGGGDGAPITLAAGRLGEVILEFDLLEGFRVSAPYWHFENLVIRGVCKDDGDCEHAFHVVGPAAHVEIRNNRIEDFNAQIKVNGEAGRFPDAGVIEENSLVANHPRRTGHPVTPIDMVAVNGWRIRGNLIADFIKRDGDGISYAAFVKGGGHDNRFESNLVLCEYRLRGLPGMRVGLSLGGGGTDPAFCRDHRCITEQEISVVRDNLIAFCSDDGLYLNRASGSLVVQNTLLDTAGLGLRGEETSGRFSGNLLDGGIRAREGADLEYVDNQISGRLGAYFGHHPVRSLFRDPDALDLVWTDRAPQGSLPIAEEVGPKETDLCGKLRPAKPAQGAFEDYGACLKPRKS
jgi:hypothetical protein